MVNEDTLNISLEHLLAATTMMTLQKALDTFHAAGIETTRLIKAQSTQRVIEIVLTNDSQELNLKPNEKIGWRLLTTEFLQEEAKLYGTKLPFRAETKILFLSGDGKTNDLRFIFQFTGDPVRTKPAEYFKPPERDEVIGAISDYTDGKTNEDNAAIAKVISEIADVFYNLIQLTETDPDFKETYILWFNQLAISLGYTHEQAMAVAIAKYHHRMFKNGGKNDFEKENQLIVEMLTSDQIPQLTKKTASNFAALVNILCNQVLISRLTMLKAEFNLSKRNVADGLLARTLYQTFAQSTIEIGETKVDDKTQLSRSDKDGPSTIIATDPLDSTKPRFE
ncbi:MAG: hypothetical protein H6772_04220 [Pseudomonadales bacterium]|nr:hypothetical protein [Pseudomonadales bacterium]